MDKYKVIEDDSSYDNQFKTLSDAYQFIDSDAKIVTLRDYIKDKLLDVMTFDDYTHFIDDLNELSNRISSYSYDIENIDEIFIITTNDKNVIFLENAFFIPVLNSILKEFGYNVYIAKHDKIVNENLKKYLMNHTNNFIKIVTYLINHNNKLNCIMWTDIKIDNQLVQAVCEERYDKNDPYNAIQNGVLYSATEYEVLNEFMKDIDHIVDLIINNINELSQAFSKEISREFFQIVL